MGWRAAFGSPGHQRPFTNRRSTRPSPSASNAATPDPIVSGIHFFPSAPFTWTNETPEDFVTSSNRMDEATFVGSGAGVGETGFWGVFVQAAARRRAGRRREEERISLNGHFTEMLPHARQVGFRRRVPQ